MADTRADTEGDRDELEHDFLDKAKSFEWVAVKSMLKEQPDLINVQPCGRWSALHQAAYEGNATIAEELVKLGASTIATNRQGKTPAQVAKGEAKKALEALAPPAPARGAAPAAAASPARGGVKREVEVKEEPAEAAAADAVEEPPAKKAKKKAAVAYTLNINDALDKEYHDCKLLEVSAAPTSALLGLGNPGRETLKKFRVRTIRDLGTWKFYRMAKCMVGLGELEVEGGRSEASAMNVNMAVDKSQRKKSLKELLQEPPSALNGLAPWADEEFKSLGINTIEEFGKWKYARWAEWVTELSQFEEQD